MNTIADKVFALDPSIRYVAVNQGGEITEMMQNPALPSHNPHDTDRMEELLVNPTVLELTRRRGELDLDGIRYVVIRYGPQYQLIMPYKEGHISIGLELSADTAAIAKKVAGHLKLPI